MESTYWQDWEALDEAELDEALDEAEAYGSDEGENEDAESFRMRGRFPARPMAPVRGIRTATIETPAGNARLKLPAPVPTVREVGNVRRQVQTSRSEIERLQRKVRRLERQGTFGANLGIVANAIGQLKDVFMDVYAARQVASANGLDLRPLAPPSPAPVTP